MLSVYLFLYNKRHPDHKERGKKLQAWNEIGDIFGIESTGCRATERALCSEDMLQALCNALGACATSFHGPVTSWEVLHGGGRGSMATPKVLLLPHTGQCKTLCALHILMQPKNLVHFFKCMDSSCSFTSDDDDLFLVHLSAHREQALLCVYCGLLATSGPRLIKHMVTAHGSRKAQCSLCLYRACSETHLAVHTAIAHEGSVLPWYLCKNIAPPVVQPLSLGDVSAALYRLEVGLTRVEGEWTAKFEELKGEFEEKRKKQAVLETQVKELNDKLGQEREKRAELENLGKVRSTQRSKKDKHEAMEWQLEGRSTREKEGELNVSRCTAGIASRVWGDKRVKVAAFPGRGMKEVMDTAVEMLTVNKVEENLLRVEGEGTWPHIEEGVRQLKVIASGMAHIVMCIIPEVRGRGVGGAGQYAEPPCIWLKASLSPRAELRYGLRGLQPRVPGGPVLVPKNLIQIGGRGTPQGAVLSPLLFNLALLKLPPALAAIPGLHHSMYADDITLWVTKGSDAELEETLKLGVHTVCTIAAQAGRASTHHKLFTHRSDVLYVDAAEYGHRPAFAAVATTSTGQVKTCATVFTAFPEQAEEAAIALALTATPCPKVIVSDSKAAILNFAKGYISAPAQTILRAKPPNSFESNVSLIWTPAHAGLCGNELAHSTARGYTVRAGWTQSLDREARSARERLVGFYDITSHYRLSRRLYPPATQALSREESVMWRQLQTHSFPSPLVLSHIYPSLYNPTCIFCSARATLSHILWECPSFHLSPFPSEERWDAALRSSDPTTGPSGCRGRRGPWASGHQVWLTAEGARK
ncbi:hypothetical protein HPB47_025429 [Ixodes persulcatus]|uniref:Uncharacterized protein n=1 Tax=Ixodes persulcatus TaxID=34615 RepID=A0AC60Q1J0_IXOPE|nr:hypothetical protein HPB47_025429 [Ixodes persulcatus]